MTSFLHSPITSTIISLLFLHT